MYVYSRVEINVIQKNACLVINPITAGNFAALFSCKPVCRASDLMTGNDRFELDFFYFD